MAEPLGIETYCRLLSRSPAEVLFNTCEVFAVIQWNSGVLVGLDVAEIFLSWVVIEHVERTQSTKPWKEDWQGRLSKKCHNRPKIILLFPGSVVQSLLGRSIEDIESQSWKAAEWNSYRPCLNHTLLRSPYRQAGHPSKEAHCYCLRSPSASWSACIVSSSFLWTESSFPVAVCYWPPFCFLGWAEWLFAVFS